MNLRGEDSLASLARVADADLRIAEEGRKKDGE
jgi:hypothetical protein